MAIPTNYEELEAVVLDWLNREDLLEQVPEFIAYAESKINRVSRLSQQEVQASITMTAGQEYSDLPIGFLEIISLDFQNETYEPMQKVALEVLDEYKTLNVTGIPAYYAISGNKFYWDVLPNSPYVLTARYWKKWNIAADATNWLLTNNPDVYIFTALSYAGEYIDHPRQEKWEAKSNLILQEIEYQSAKLKKAALRVDVGLLRPRIYNIFRDY